MDIRWPWWTVWVGRLVSCAPVAMVLMSARWKLTHDPWYVQEFARIGWAASMLELLAVATVHLNSGAIGKPCAIRVCRHRIGRAYTLHRLEEFAGRHARKFARREDSPRYAHAEGTALHGQQRSVGTLNRNVSRDYNMRDGSRCVRRKCPHGSRTFPSSGRFYAG
jgi:hypothetical protein